MNITAAGKVEIVDWKSITIVYILFGILTLLGNVSVIYAYFKLKTLRTLTNKFVASSAVCGVVISVFYVPFYLVFDKLTSSISTLAAPTSSLIAAFSGFGILFNVAAITSERYIAISYSLRYRAILTKKRVYAMIGGVWILPFVLATTPFILPWIIKDPTEVELCFQIYQGFLAVIISVTLLWIFIAYVRITLFRKKHVQFDRIQKKRLQQLLISESHERADSNQRNVTGKTLGRFLDVSCFSRRHSCCRKTHSNSPIDKDFVNPFMSPFDINLNIKETDPNDFLLHQSTLKHLLSPVSVDKEGFHSMNGVANSTIKNNDNSFLNDNIESQYEQTTPDQEIKMHVSVSSASLEPGLTLFSPLKCLNKNKFNNLHQKRSQSSEQFSVDRMIPKHKTIHLLYMKEKSHSDSDLTELLYENRVGEPKHKKNKQSCFANPTTCNDPLIFPKIDQCETLLYEFPGLVENENAYEKSHSSDSRDDVHDNNQSQCDLAANISQKNSLENNPDGPVPNEFYQKHPYKPRLRLSHLDYVSRSCVLSPRSVFLTRNWNKIRDSKRITGRKGSKHVMIQAREFLLEVKNTKMIAIIFLTNALCWMPLIYINFTIALGREDLVSPRLMVASQFLFMINSLLMPYIYALCKRDFKAALKQILMGKR